MKKMPGIVLLATMAALLFTFVTSAQPAGFELVCFELNSGAGHSSGGDYSLDSTIGRPATTTLSGGGFTLTSGCQGSSPTLTLYLPIIVHR